MKSLILLSLILLTPLRSRADIIFPPGERTNLGTSAKPDYRQCYNINDYKQLLLLQINYSSCLETKTVLEEKVIVQDQIIIKLERVVKLQDETIKIQDSQKTKFFDMWKTENLKRYELENKPKIKEWVAWSLAALFGAATVFLTGYVIAQ